MVPSVLRPPFAETRPFHKVEDNGDVCVSVPRVKTGFRGCPSRSKLKASESLQYVLNVSLVFFFLEIVS